jgi:hypothetical protein
MLTRVHGGEENKIKGFGTFVETSQVSTKSFYIPVFGLVSSFTDTTDHDWYQLSSLFSDLNQFSIFSF